MTYGTYFRALRCRPLLRVVLHGLFALAFVLASPAAQAEDPLHEQTEQFFPLPLDGAITLENTDGSIHVFGWYEPRVRLAVLRNAYTASRLQQIRAETKLAPNSLAVRSVIPPVHGIFADRSGTIDYTLNVPETAHLKLKLTTGEVTLQGLRGGSASIELTNGRITALNCFARVDASSRNGVMEVFFDWWENLPATFDYALQHGRIGAIAPGDGAIPRRGGDAERPDRERLWIQKSLEPRSWPGIERSDRGRCACYPPFPHRRR